MKSLLKTTIAALLLSAPVWAYVTAKTLSSTGDIVQQKWRSGSFPIQWRMNPAVGSNVTGSREQADVMRESFQAWQSAATASITFTEGPSTTNAPGFDNINLVSSSVTAAQYNSSALGLTLVFSFTEGGPGLVDQFNRPIEFPGQIVEADIMFNPLEQFTLNSTAVSNRVDFQSVATHEIGHLLGLDHTTLLSSTMFPSIADGFNYAKTLSTDDIAAVSTIYPSASFATKGKLSGTVRTTTNVPVYGAIVVAVNASGQPVASAVTNPSGVYTIEGLDAGAYTLYAEPLDQPKPPGEPSGITINNLQSLTRIYPSSTVNTNFTTRFR